ncbi:hypothetical protein AGLY_012319 [Aphis glycines]|uniref:Uncharacterized protein n=1 Tax=Aphis glycines TaxID=307491 RepID=A0A6G0TBY2_APHGL|nr:hypothetical protein AGLY_012319 [Aphis glycines]
MLTFYLYNAPMIFTFTSGTTSIINTLTVDIGGKIVYTMFIPKPGSSIPRSPIYKIYTLTSIIVTYFYDEWILVCNFNEFRFLFLSQRENNDFQANIYSIALITLSSVIGSCTKLSSINYEMWPFSDHAKYVHNVFVTIVFITFIIRMIGDITAITSCRLINCNSNILFILAYASTMLDEQQRKAILTSLLKTNKCEDVDLLKLANTKSGFSNYHLTVVEYTIIKNLESMGRSPFGSHFPKRLPFYKKINFQTAPVKKVLRTVRLQDLVITYNVYTPYRIIECMVFRMQDA